MPQRIKRKKVKDSRYIKYGTGQFKKGAIVALLLVAFIALFFAFAPAQYLEALGNEISRIINELIKALSGGK